jgi:hypothetical protein
MFGKPRIWGQAVVRFVRGGTRGIPHSMRRIPVGRLTPSPFLLRPVGFHLRPTGFGGQVGGQVGGQIGLRRGSLGNLGVLLRRLPVIPLGQPRWRWVFGMSKTKPERATMAKCQGRGFGSWLLVGRDWYRGFWLRCCKLSGSSAVSWLGIGRFPNLGLCWLPGTQGNPNLGLCWLPGTQGNPVSGSGRGRCRGPPLRLRGGIAALMLRGRT